MISTKSIFQQLGPAGWPGRRVGARGRPGGVGPFRYSSEVASDSNSNSDSGGDSGMTVAVTVTAAELLWKAGGTDQDRALVVLAAGHALATAEMAIAATAGFAGQAEHALQLADHLREPVETAVAVQIHSVQIAACPSVNVSVPIQQVTANLKTQMPK